MFITSFEHITLVSTPSHVQVGCYAAATCASNYSRTAASTIPSRVGAFAVTADAEEDVTVPGALSG